MQETIVSSEEVFHGRLVKLFVHEVELSNGSHSKREVVKHPGAVALVALDEQQNVLLVRQFRLPAAQVLREIPAGTLEEGEAPLACAERELQEETGYRPGKLEELGGIFVAPGYTTEYIHLYLATQLRESRLDADADEFVEVDHVPIKDALAMIEKGDIIDGKSVAGLLRVARKLGL